MTPNARWQFVLVYTMPGGAKERAVEDVVAAVDAGALRVGEEAGLPLHHYPLEQTADAHRAVQEGVVARCSSMSRTARRRARRSAEATGA